MISRLELWLHDIVLDAIKAHEDKQANIIDIITERDPDEGDNDYPSGCIWKNTKTEKNWRLQKTWKKIPKKKKTPTTKK